ncbi:hypothetical protein SBA1_30059 [Candidatus Sulfotelmatobacter kueseliae]|uniref:Uncharacterized protein n=1 Tax=Candidatus Sulfotelmatobacter kueseliae TaxID=2042962 RepID=A0A2U3KKL7_9BACT|nr:hypothetical protein SBA1_30059 [Candidatus Sulfotelmatobacter kueseliae]
MTQPSASQQIPRVGQVRWSNAYVSEGQDLARHLSFGEQSLALVIKVKAPLSIQT